MTFSCFCFLVLMSWYTYYPMVHLHIIQLSGKYMYNRKLTGIEKKNMYNRVCNVYFRCNAHIDHRVETVQ